MSNDTYGIVDQRTLGSYNRALKRLRDRHGKEFWGLLDEERIKDRRKDLAARTGRP